MQRPRNPIFAFLREPVTIAVVAALLITGGLSAVVLGLWSEPGATTNPVVQLAALSPTPRAVRRQTAPAPATPPAAAGTPALTHSPQAADIAIGIAPGPSPSVAAPTQPPAAPTALPTATPAPTSPPLTLAAPTATTVPPPAFAANSASDIAALASGRWRAEDDRLILTSPPLVAEPWLSLPVTLDAETVTISARIRVTALTAGVCNQSFGLVIARGNQARGGGEFFPCDSEGVVARLTDVADWQDGYDRDRTLDSNPSQQTSAWRDVTLTRDGTSLILTIDGEEIARATDATFTGSDDLTFGIWSQGVELEIEEIVVTELR